jgi:Protein of unknown function (DUF1460)
MRNCVKRHWKILSISAILSGAGVVGAWMMPDRSTQASQPNALQPTPQAARQTAAIAIPKLSPADRQKFVTLHQSFQRQQWQKLDLGDRLQVIAEQFMGDPYRANLLDQSTTEQPFISLQEFDCVLFLETVLALNSTLLEKPKVSESKNLVSTFDPTVSSSPTELALFQNLQQYRYRDGKLDNYCDRLHYFSDWVLDNQQRGLVKDIGTVPLKRSLSFMSQNWRKYSPIVKDPSLKDCIQTTESRLSQKLQSGQLNYIPIESLRSQENQLRSGDIIGLVTNLKGLDVTHSGFLYRKGSQTPAGLLHASQRSGIKVSANLERYVRGVDGAIGIIVARPIDPVLRKLDGNSLIK